MIVVGAKGQNNEPQRGSERVAVDRPVLYKLPVPIIEVQPSKDPRQEMASLRDTPDERDRGLVGPRVVAGSLSPSLPSRGSSGSVPTVAPGTPYVYRGLQGAEFRLLRLLPESMSAIKCQLINTTLDDPPKYMALSYAWGNGDDTAEIRVDGHRHKITTSLYGALRRLRRPRESVYVWADAVCINQQDKAELSQQVRYMTSIFLQAESVAIWLGPEADDSNLAISLVRRTVRAAGSAAAMRELISMRELRAHFAALVALFERAYWKRLWVVQEVLSATAKTVYCGRDEVSWADLITASEAFAKHAADLNYFYPSGLSSSARHQLSQPLHSYARVLGSRGPASFHALQSIQDGGPRTLLDVLHTCRTKLSADPRDKVFAILGILPEHVGADFPIDYSASVREVYTNVVDFLLHSDRLDVICEAIYFPLHSGNAALPTWVPDWSHIPQTGALGLSYDFSAAGDSKPEFELLQQRSRLKLTALQLDTVAVHGIAVGTLCTLDDYLMAFLHWRAKMLGNAKVRDRYGDDRIHDAFCRTLRLGQSDQASKSSREKGDWTSICYHIYASLLRDRLPYIALDRQLSEYASMTNLGVEPDERRGILQVNCGSRMMGRCFFITQSGMLGLGTGFMDSGDVVCVPLGCNTPVLLRAEGGHGEYRLVGDCYVDGYMHGEAMASGAFETTSFVLH
ncbi:heterokaryon incompatibility protein-domain-containing protein [Microdochium trichocladiopsis]|uniref:Heterokaryon incompatibility protein-domain-containing protein n=1 Tax=Microdochium trichocladiopsis TaxID=1682393 RepID=A0A9P9BMK3_9PEZI|nr:heterokaryon incompatibility protein-domain-containing protein [Microdochium trichocladiopsis]KAH7026365.1 heterokaryon incompatibility protein-domain-containing protein [Microdochium trichocladiopsis]